MHSEQNTIMCRLRDAHTSGELSAMDLTQAMATDKNLDHTFVVGWLYGHARATNEVVSFFSKASPHKDPEEEMVKTGEGQETRDSASYEADAKFWSGKIHHIKDYGTDNQEEGSPPDSPPEAG